MQTSKLLAGLNRRLIILLNQKELYFFMERTFLWKDIPPEIVPIAEARQVDLELQAVYKAISKAMGHEYDISTKPHFEQIGFRMD